MAVGLAAIALHSTGLQQVSNPNPMSHRPRLASDAEVAEKRLYGRQGVAPPWAHGSAQRAQGLGAAVSPPTRCAAQDCISPGYPNPMGDGARLASGWEAAEKRLDGRLGAAPPLGAWPRATGAGPLGGGLAAHAQCSTGLHQLRRPHPIGREPRLASDGEASNVSLDGRLGAATPRAHGPAQRAQCRGPTDSPPTRCATQDCISSVTRIPWASKRDWPPTRRPLRSASTGGRASRPPGRMAPRRGRRPAGRRTRRPRAAQHRTAAA